MQRDLQFLLDMLQSAELIVTYMNQFSKPEFVKNVQLQDSVIRRILVIAEAARRVSESTRQILPNSGSYNVLFHPLLNPGSTH
jgi:uncharacterized protein with HEPN domain